MVLGRITAIHLASERGAPVDAVDTTRAVAGRGLEGDRYFLEEGTFTDRDGSDVTLIEAETLERVGRDYDLALGGGSHRRNVTTAGVALNHLVDREFRLGEARCLGTELCEPCSYLESHLEARGVREALVHRGGLRARILESGPVAVGDSLEGC